MKGDYLWGVEGAGLQRVLIDEAIEVLCQRAWDSGPIGLWAIHQPRSASVGKAIRPLPRGRRRTLARLGDVVEHSWNGLGQGMAAVYPCDGGAGLTNYVWLLTEVLLYQVPPWPQPQSV